MPWGAAIGAIGGALISSSSADSASDAAVGASERSVKETKRQFDLIRGDTKLYRDVGQGALFRLAEIFGIPNQGPGPAPTLKYDDGTLAPSIQGLTNDERAELDLLMSFTPDKVVDGTGVVTEAYRDLVEEYGGEENMQRRSQLLQQKDQESRLAQRVSGALSPNQPAAPLAPAQASGQSIADKVLQASPGYQFRLNEAQKALERNQSRYRFTPRAAKELTRYSQDFASNEFGKLQESLFRLSGIGGNAVNTSAGAGLSAAGQIGAANQFGGAAQAGAAIAGGAGINNALQGGLSNYFTLQEYNKSRPIEFYGVGNSPY